MGVPVSAAPSNHDRLDSWKEIAAYLGRSVRTVIRWEQTEGLPVYRHQHEKKSSVYAFRRELDAWWAGRRADLERETAPAATPPKRERVWILLAAAVTAVGVIGYAVWRRPVPAAEPLRPEVLTSYPGYQSLPTLSPDASHVAFTWSPPGMTNPDIYVQSMGSSEPRRLTEHPHIDFSPAWSPDGKWLAFLRRTPEWNTSILIIPASGGGERKVAELSMAHYMDATQLAWSPDGHWLTVPDYEGKDQGLFLMAVEGGTAIRLTSSGAPRGHMDPQFSPDGRHLAFRCENVECRSEICILDLGRALRPAGKPETITRLGVRATSPVWSSDGRSVIFSAGYFLSDSALYRVTVFPASARRQPPRKLVSEGPEQYSLAMSRQGGTLVYTRRQDDANLWIVEREKGAWKPARMLSVFASNRVERSPDLSPDGKLLAFASNRHGPMELWIGERDGSHLRQLTSFAMEAAWSVRWSPDGKKLAVSTGERGGALYVLDVVGGQPRKLASSALDPCWSPDGEWIFYWRAWTMPPGIFKIKAEGGAEVPVALAGCARPVLARDGRTLYLGVQGTRGKMPAATMSVSGIWSRPLSASSGEKLVVAGQFRSFALGPDGLFAITNTSPHRLEFYPFQGGPPEVLATLRDPYTGFTVSRDGNTVIFSSVDSMQTNLMLIKGM